MGIELDVEKILNTPIPEDELLGLMLMPGMDLDEYVSRTYAIPEASYLADIQRAGEERNIENGLEAALNIEKVMLANGAYYRDLDKRGTEEIVNDMRESVNKNPIRIFEEYSLNYMIFLDYAKVFLAPSKVPGVHAELSDLEELRHKVYRGPDKETMEKSLDLLGYKETTEWVLAGLKRTMKFAEFYGSSTSWAENNEGAASNLISESERIKKIIEDVRKGKGYKPYFLPSKEEWMQREQPLTFFD